MAILLSFTFDEETVRKLNAMFESSKRSQGLRELIAAEYEKRFNDSESAHAPTEPESTPEAA
jgi:hypothetical protein